MKKALALLTLASLGALSFGCALTDYGSTTPGGPLMTTLNKSHGVIGCTTDDRFANAQQTIERDTRNLNYTLRDATGQTICPVFGPSPSSTNVGHEDAKDWNRFNAAWVFLGEAQVFSPASLQGTYMMGGVKDLADGSARINSYYAAGTGQFTCVGGAVGGVYGAPEGTVVGDGLTNPGQAGPRIPGLILDTIAIDSAPGLGWCGNIVAVNNARANRVDLAAFGGYSTFWGILGRTGEGRLHFSPITRRDGLSGFLNGESMTINVLGVSATAAGELNADGTWKVTLQSLESNGVTYTAGENPIYFVASPKNNFRTMEVHITDRAELVNLAHFGLDAGLNDRQFDLTGVKVEELGLSLPSATVMVSGAAMEHIINNSTSGNQDGGGLGG